MNNTFINIGLLMLVGLSFSGCGGGYGVPLTPKVVCDKIEIDRMPLAAIPSHDYRLLLFPDYPDSIKEERASVERFGGWINSQYSHVYPVRFQGRQLDLALSQGKNTLNILSGTNCIKRIGLPRYGIMTRALVWELERESLLVVYVNLQKSSNSSVLMVLNDKLDVLYMEHLTGAKALGEGKSLANGPFVVVKANEILVRPGTEERQKIVGEWVYYSGIGVRSPQATNEMTR
ncbi:MAG: hypothetical protein WCO77_13270 [bacterium]